MTPQEVIKLLEKIKGDQVINEYSSLATDMLLTNINEAIKDLKKK